MSLWKEIECGEGLNRIAACEEFFEIARERGGIAGDVRDLRGMEIQDAFDYG